MCSEAGLVNGLWGYQALRQAELARDLYPELILAHRLRPDDMIQAVQASIQHFDQNFPQVVDEHGAKSHIRKAVDGSSIAQVIDEKFR